MKRKALTNLITVLLLLSTIIVGVTIVSKNPELQFIHKEKIEDEPYNIVYGGKDDRVSGSMGVILYIEHYDSSGNLKGTVTKNDDLILTNFAKFLWIMTLGTDSMPTWYNTAGGSDDAITNNPNEIHGENSLIHIGNSSSPVDKDDYSLTSEVDNISPSTVDYDSSGTSMNATTTAVFTITDTNDIYEFGLSTTALGTGQIMMCKDVLVSPISVTNGDTLAVSYIIQLN